MKKLRKQLSVFSLVMLTSLSLLGASPAASYASISMSSQQIQSETLLSFVTHEIPSFLSQQLQTIEHAIVAVLPHTRSSESTEKHLADIPNDNTKQTTIVAPIPQKEVLAATNTAARGTQTTPQLLILPEGLTLDKLPTNTVNLLHNSSFEQQNDGQPRGWNYQLDSNTGNTFISQEGNRSGVFGLKFVGGRTGNLGISQPDVKTVPKRTYTFSLYVKTTNVPSKTSLRFGFWDEYHNTEGQMRSVPLPGTQDWTRESVTITTPGLITDPKNEFPLIEVQGLTTGAVYLDDLQLTEGNLSTVYNSSQAYTSSQGIGDGSILFSTGGDIFPASNNTGQLGSTTNQFSALNLTNASIDSNGSLNINGGGTVKGSLTVNGVTTLNGSLTLGTNATNTIGLNGQLSSSLIPSVTDTYNLGSSTNEWNNLYAKTLNISGGQNVGGNFSVSGTLAANGGSLTTTASTFNLLNAAATTINFGGAATSLNIGAATGTTTVNNTLSIAGNLGIGTTNPQYPLQVNEGANGAILAQGVSGNNLGNADILLRTASGNGYWDVATDNNASGAFTIYDNINDKNPFYIEENTPSNTLYLKSSGNVGVGTTTPNALLQVAGTASVSGQLTLYGTPTIQSTANQTLTLGGNTTGDILLQPHNSQGAGNVLINQGGNGQIELGYADPGIGAFISNDGANTVLSTYTGDMYIGYSGDSKNLRFMGGGGTTQMILTSGGNVGVGTTTPINELQVNGDIGFGKANTRAGTAVFYPANNGTWLGIQNDAGNGLNFGHVPGTSPESVDQSYLYVKNGGGVGVGITSLDSGADLEIKAPSGSNPADLFLVDGNTTNKWDLFAGSNGVTGLYDATNNKTPFQIEANTPTNTLYLKSTGNVGIGTTNPHKALEVNGDITFSAQGQALCFDSVPNSCNNALYRDSSSSTFLTAPGGGGIALITNGTHYLDVTSNGNVTVNDPFTYNATFDTNALSGTLPIGYFHGSTSFAGLEVNNTGVGDLFTASQSGNPKFVITNAGNVGVGTTNPVAALDVGPGGGQANPKFMILEDYLTNSNGGAQLLGNWNASAYWALGTVDNTNGDQMMRIGVGNNSSNWNANQTLSVLIDGAPGIKPLAASGLDVERNSLGNSALVVNNVGGAGDIFTASSAGTPRFVIDQSGRVGIQVAHPTADLQLSPSSVIQLGTTAQTTNPSYVYVADESNNANGNASYVGNWNNNNFWGIGPATNNSTDNTLRLGITSGGNTWASTQNLSILLGGALGNSALKASALDIEQNSLGNAAFVVNNSGGAGDLFTASASGNPLFKIDHAGNTRVGGSLCVKGTLSTACAGNTAGTIYATNTTVQAADVAENYVSSQTLEPGDVIMPAQDGDNQAVVKTTSSYQSQAIGIVSTNPGVTLNSDATTESTHPNKYPIALQGRVPVNVTTQNGTIQAGDMLTSSSIPGVAMKATRAGQIIGKALESFSNPDPHAIGKILMFVNISWSDPTVQITDSGNLSVNGQTVGDTSTLAVTSMVPPPTTPGAPSVSPEQLNQLAAAVSDLQSQTASWSAQLGKLDDLSKQLADLEKTVNLTQLLQGASTQSAVLGTSTTNEDTTISGKLNVLGRTLLTDLGVTGTINAGLLTINGMDTSSATASATINTLSGPLKLQSLGLGGLDILNGKITIDTNGNLVVNGNITTKTIHADKYEATDTGNNASIGEAIIPAGQTSITIKTTAVTNASKIFVTPRSKTGEQPLIVGSVTSGSSFTVEIEKPNTTDIHCDWWIVN